MANSFDSAQCVNGKMLDWSYIDTCDPLPTFDNLIGGLVGVLVAASPIGGLVGRAVGGAVAGVAAAKLVKKYLKNEDIE